MASANRHGANSNLHCCTILSPLLASIFISQDPPPGSLPKCFRNCPEAPCEMWQARWPVLSYAVKAPPQLPPSPSWECLYIYSLVQHGHGKSKVHRLCCQRETPMEDLALPSLVVELKDAFLLCTFKLLSCGGATERLVAPSRVDVNFSTKVTMMKGSSYCYRQFMILRQQCDGFHGNQSRIRLCHHTVCMFKVIFLKAEPLPSTTPLLPCFQKDQFSVTNWTVYPIGPMYGIYANIGGILMVNVT